ncbi:MAG: indole-3-glycerol phosphate synthase TrpC [Chitinophagaceae bacterium]
MNILEEIVAYKKLEIQQRKLELPVKALEQQLPGTKRTYSLREFLNYPGTTGIIAEFKRRSPSKGVFHLQADPVVITRAYTSYGASGLSVLTDYQFFGGSTEDLQKVREVNLIPILRKDFMIDPYQILEARIMGADVILLIAACLSAHEISSLARLAKDLGLEVLLEIHGEKELDKICPEIGLVGVNNRDLTSFRVDIDRSFFLADKIPPDRIKIAESGISQPQMVLELKAAGFQGFLMGEAFMKTPDPGAALGTFIQSLKSLTPLKN